MEIISIVIITIIGIITSIILKGYKPEFSFFIILILSFFFFGWIISIFRELWSKLEFLTAFYEENKFFYNILFKITGITYLCEFTSGICKDAGYGAIAAQVEITGRILVLLASVPVLLAVISMIYEYRI
ncbi:MAG: hypothetical protein IKW28_11660 [Lachnospiraceae bacterium]|nr:hypothetical protein [Lachnospiraceae bacterium]